MQTVACCDRVWRAVLALCGFCGEAGDCHHRGLVAYLAEQAGCCDLSPAMCTPLAW